MVIVTKVSLLMVKGMDMGNIFMIMVNNLIPNSLMVFLKL